MTEYKAENFKGMMFPFHKVEHDILSTFPKLSAYNEFLYDTPYKDETIRYIGFAYDKGSPLQKIENIIHRKVEAAQLAGFKNTDEEYVQDVMKCRNPAVNLMIVRYCRMMGSRTYMLIIAGTESINESVLQILNFEKSKKKNELENSETRLKLFSQVKETVKDLDALSRQFLSDDNPEINDVLYRISDMTEEEYINLTPEDFSKESWEQEHPKITSNGE